MSNDPNGVFTSFLFVDFVTGGSGSRSMDNCDSIIKLLIDRIEYLFSNQLVSKIKMYCLRDLFSKKMELSFQYFFKGIKYVYSARFL